MSIPRLDISAVMPAQLLTNRPHRAASRVAIAAALELHHESHMPNHFETFSGAKYGMSKRTDKYNKRKLRLKGHNRYLVFSGTLRHSVLDARRITVSHNPPGGKLYMNADLSGTVKNADQIKNARIGRVGIMRLKDQNARMRLGLGPMSRLQARATEEALKRQAELLADTPDEKAAMVRKLGDTYAREVTAFIASGGKLKTKLTP